MAVLARDSHCQLYKHQAVKKPCPLLCSKTAWKETGSLCRTRDLSKPADCGFSFCKGRAWVDL